MMKLIVRRHIFPILPGATLLLVISLVNALLMPRFVKLLPSSLLLAMPVAYLAMGETLVLLVGEVDLSLGAVLMFINAVTVSAYTDFGITGPYFLLVPILTGLLVGTIHGVFISFGRLNSFLTTVGGSFIWSGLALVILREPRGDVPPWFSQAFSGSLAGMPFAAWALIAAIVMWLLFSFSPIASSFAAVGSAPKAAYALGLNVNRIKFYAFVLNGFFSGVAGLIITGIIGSGDPRLGTLSTVLAILASLLGGASFSGGTGNGIGAAMAAIGLQFARNLVAWIGVTYYLLDLVYGAVIIALISLISFLRSKVEDKSY